MKALTLIIALLCCTCLTSFAQGNYFWKPSSGNNMNTAANWRIATCNGTVSSVVPGASDTILFSSCNTGSCTINANLSVAQINIQSTYTGTISFSGGSTLTFGIGKFKGGTFTGSSGAITATVSLNIDGCAFTSTSDTLKVTGDFTYKGSSFAHNNGTIVFKKGVGTTTAFNGTSNAATTLTLYNVEFAAPSATTQFNIRNMTMVIEHQMNITGSNQLFLNTNTASTVEVRGNLTNINTEQSGGGTITLLVNGTGSQSITGPGAIDQGKFPNVIIDKSAGTLSLYGNIMLGGSTTWKYTSGTISEGTAKMICYYNNTLYNNSGTTMRFNRLTFYGRGDNHTVTGKITVTDTLATALTGDCIIDGDTIEAQGNIKWNNTSGGSSLNAALKLTGSSAQLISGSATLPLSNVLVSKTSGDITLNEPVNISNTIKFVTGYVVSDTTNLLTIKNGATVSDASNSSFVTGPVKKIGNAAFTFPVGKDSVYNPMEITAPSSSTDAFTAEYFNYIQPHGFTADSLTYVSVCEFWNIQRIAGSSNVKITLHWNSSSCDIYTLTTLRIGRWDGSKWNNTGPVTTTGNTTSGTIQTNSNQSAFGDFVISKRSSPVVAHAGSDANINLGSTATLGGSPSATGGTAPYSYKWVTDYALSSDTAHNPTANPFSTYTYYLKVTDLDKSVALDTIKITVNGFDLKTATRFPILTDDSLILDSSASVVGAVGVRQHIVGSVIATDSILVNTTSSNLAVRHVDTAMQKIDALSASTVSSTLNGQTLTGGVYRVNSNATLNGTITLQGNSSTYIVLDINGDLSILDNSSIILDGIDWNQVYVHANNVAITGNAILNGIFLLSGYFNGDVSSGDIWIMSKGKIRGKIPGIKNIITIFLTGPARDINNYFGYNASNVTKHDGYGSTNFGTHINGDKLLALKPDLLRYPGGADANWWRWQTGWFRG